MVITLKGNPLRGYVIPRFQICIVYNFLCVLVVAKYLIRDMLLQIRRGFDYTREMLFQNEKLQKIVESQSMSYVEISAQLRLYSTDKIFNEYMHLFQFSHFSYAPESGPHLFEDSKWAYDMQITLLARQMQEDLGYRKYNNEFDLIVCPECGRSHDIVSTCACGLTSVCLMNR